MRPPKQPEFRCFPQVKTARTETLSGAVCAGSNPAGGAHNKGTVYRILLRRDRCDVAVDVVQAQIPLGLVQAAIAYYGAYTDEIDEQIPDNDQAAAEAYAAYLAGQAALRR